MNWIASNWIEIFGAVTGILYVFLEVRQNLWLWPVGIITSGVYIIVFFTGKLYADMSLQAYYLAVSFYGWFYWIRGAALRKVMVSGTGAASQKLHPVRSADYHEGNEDREAGKVPVTRLRLKPALILLIVFMALWLGMYLVLSGFTDSPVPIADSFVTSLSVVATWMLARKIYEHWYLWLVVNTVSAALFFSRDLYATVILYIIYFIMSFAGLRAWKKDLPAVAK